MSRFHVARAERFWMTPAEVPEFRLRQQARWWSVAALLGALLLLWRGPGSELGLTAAGTLLLGAGAARAYARGWNART